MNYYEIWFNLRDSHRDLEFADHLDAYLGYLQEQKKIAGWRLTRRKFGFGPPELGEFHVTITAETLAQLDEAFMSVAPRSGKVQDLHAAVYDRVSDFRSALYRDFPDPQRVR